MFLSFLEKDMARRIGLFAGGFLFGTAGLKILGSDDAKKVYTKCLAAVLRGKDCILTQKDIIVENCSDIYADAVEINDKRDAERREREYREAEELLKEKKEALEVNTEEIAF